MIYDKIKKLKFKTIVEAGGNTGADTMRLCDMFPKATIYTFEPIPILYNHIKSMTKQNLKLYNKALSTDNGYIDFHVDMNPEGSAGASSILPTTKHYLNYIKREETIIVPCITLEKFMQDMGIKNIDFLWLDIEMMEYKVLKASEKILKNIEYIYTEISYSNFRIGQNTPEELDKLLISNGFDQVFIEPQGSPNFDWQANALYKRT